VNKIHGRGANGDFIPCLYVLEPIYVVVALEDEHLYQDKSWNNDPKGCKLASQICWYQFVFLGGK